MVSYQRVEMAGCTLEANVKKLAHAVMLFRCMCFCHSSTAVSDLRALAACRTLVAGTTIGTEQMKLPISLVAGFHGQRRERGGGGGGGKVSKRPLCAHVSLMLCRTQICHARSGFFVRAKTSSGHAGFAGHAGARERSTRAQ
jgi:hypothetical protein